MRSILSVLCLAATVLAQDSALPTEVEPGQYVHNPEWDLTPYQLWKRRQAAKGQAEPSTNSLPASRTKDLPTPRKMITVRKQKPQRQQAYIQPAPQQQQQQPAQQRFQNFRPIEQQRSAPAPRTRQQQPAFQQKPRQQAYIQPAPRQPVQPAYQQPQQPKQPAYQAQQPAYQAQQQQQAYQQPQQLAAYPRAQHQTYTPEYIFEANNNAVRAYSYDAGLYSVQSAGGTTSYTAVY